MGKWLLITGEGMLEPAALEDGETILLSIRH